MTERLIARLRTRRVLLVLDNCEHLIEMVAAVTADLVHACPGLQILSTSRAPLRVRGEHELLIDPLPVPAREHQSRAAVHQVPAVALFVQCARAVDPGFTLTDRNVAAVAEISRRLDGLPLAIELAAARCKVLPPSALLEHLTNRLAVLTDGPRDAPARQQTMRNTIAWSHALLTPDEQVVFRRLAIFVDGFTLEAAAAVLTATSALPFDALAGITALVNHSLLSPSGGSDDRPRFHMLETVREFALEQLALSSEISDTQRRHAEFCLELTERAEGGRDERRKWAPVMADYANVNRRRVVDRSGRHGGGCSIRSGVVVVLPNPRACPRWTHVD